MALCLALLAAIGAWALSLALARGARFQVRAIRKRDSSRPQPGEAARLWFFWWALVAASGLAGGLATGHPILGVVLMALFPVGRFLLIAVPRRREQRVLEEGALAFFHGLHGLLRAGFSLPTALFRLSQSVETPFSVLLKGALAGFGEGRSLSSCLARFQNRSRLSQAGLCLDLLEQAHARGLGLSAFLDRVLPWLEEEGREKDKREKARNAAWAQAGLAAALPWGVAVLAVGSPLSWSARVWSLAALGAALQIGGFWVVDRTARFE